MNKLLKIIIIGINCFILLEYPYSIIGMTIIYFNNYYYILIFPAKLLFLLLV